MTEVEKARAFLYEKIASNDSFAGQLSTVVLQATDSLIDAVTEQLQAALKKALGENAAAWKLECSRQSQAAYALGKAEEHKLVWDLIRASCCYPIDGDALFVKTLPTPEEVDNDR
jgi:hypothetical protein